MTFKQPVSRGEASLITTYHMHVCQILPPLPSPHPLHLPLLTHQHVVVGIVRDGEEVRRNFVTLLPLVYLSHFCAVDGQPFVWVDRHAEEARVGLQEGYMWR